MPYGIILKGIGGFFYVKDKDGIIFECKARGGLRKKSIAPLPGDRVVFSVSNYEMKSGSIDEICERNSVLVRPAVANVDQVAVTVAAASPDPDFLLLDKILIACEIQKLDKVIIINKIDLVDEDQYLKAFKPYKDAGFRLIAISAINEKNCALDKLKECFCGKITVFAGQSGVGKSTIINKLLERSYMETGELSKKVKRGKHTTRHAELIDFENGYIVDTPGFSLLDLKDIKYNELEQYYPEFSEYINKCKFTGCSHIAEPQCAVKDAVENGMVAKERHLRYSVLYENLKQIKEYEYNRR